VLREVNVTNSDASPGLPLDGSRPCLCRNPHRIVWAAVDSNHLPPRYQHGALPVELAAQGFGEV
jgi:hypothetical protein